MFNCLAVFYWNLGIIKIYGEVSGCRQSDIRMLLNNLLFHSKKPYKLNKMMIFYNVAMAFLSLKIFMTAVELTYMLGHNFVCEPYTVSYHRLELKLINNNWWYYISKIVEFSDTLFFILRKKNSQLSFLHIYHHSSIFFLCWVVMKWFPSGSGKRHLENFLTQITKLIFFF